MNSISILVVDDAPEALEVIAQCLRDLGHRVTTAATGRQAIMLLQESGQEFDLLITDLLMPDADGVQVIMAARRSQPLASIIAMSGGGEFFAPHYLLNLAGTLGADEKLTKPFSCGQLVDAIHRACRCQPVLAGAA